MDKRARILVTGASGMVGRSLLERLRREGYSSILSPSSRELDLRDQGAVDRYFAETPLDYVFHLAGRIGGIGANMASPVEFLRENMMIAMNAIHSARVAKVKKLIFLSSSCVYPRECSQPMREEDVLTGPFEPTNEGYAIAKVAGMKLCEYSNRQYGTEFLNLMPCNLYGYGDHFEPEKSHVVSSLIYKFHLAKQTNAASVSVWGTGKSRRELLFVTDLVEAMLYFMQNVQAKDVGRFVNIGLGRDVSIADLAHEIRNVVGYKGDIVFDPSKPDGMPRKLMDVSRAERLGWKAAIEIQRGLRMTYEWYLKNAVAPAGAA